MIIDLIEPITLAIEKEIAEAAGMTVGQLRRANRTGGTWPSHEHYQRAAAKADELRYQARD